MTSTVVAEFSDLGVFDVWVTCMVAAIIPIVAVVMLAWGITRNALTIDQDLDEVIPVAQRIQANTNPLWALEKTAGLGTQLLDTVQQIEADAGAVLARAAAGPARGMA